MDRTNNLRARRQSTTLTIAGAFVVFFTFAVHEGFQERAKDVRDTLSSAESVFLVRGGAGFVSYSLEIQDRVIQRKIKQIAVESAGGKRPVESSALDEAVILIRSQIASINSGLDNCRRLQDKIAHVSLDVIEKMETAESGLRQMRDDEASISAVVSQYSSESKNNVPEEFRSRIIELGAKSSSVAKLLMDAGDSLDRQADAQQHSNEERLATLTIASYVLYGLGWGLALFGRLKGLEIPAE